eukprot:TRINITY_DN6967_c0_g1_i1.p1 TRINITY_DN6967_c0_g1~~TRINITY_DN6967_c0_g1_i1.p1  ORF type:complete len:1495 (+),score=494.09 TRINITY_DN6967_c0_g1_i1:87-4571(+)
MPPLAAVLLRERQRQQERAFGARSAASVRAKPLFDAACHAVVLKAARGVRACGAEAVDAARVLVYPDAAVLLKKRYGGRSGAAGTSAADVYEGTVAVIRPDELSSGGVVATAAGDGERSPRGRAAEGAAALAHLGSDRVDAVLAFAAAAQAAAYVDALAHIRAAALGRGGGEAAPPPPAVPIQLRSFLYLRYPHLAAPVRRGLLAAFRHGVGGAAYTADDADAGFYPAGEDPTLLADGGGAGAPPRRDASGTSWVLAVKPEKVSLREPEGDGEKAATQARRQERVSGVRRAGEEQWLQDHRLEHAMRRAEYWRLSANARGGRGAASAAHAEVVGAHNARTEADLQAHLARRRAEEALYTPFLESTRWHRAAPSPMTGLEKGRLLGDREWEARNALLAEWAASSAALRDAFHRGRAVVARHDAEHAALAAALDHDIAQREWEDSTRQSTRLGVPRRAGNELARPALPTAATTLPATTTDAASAASGAPPPSFSTAGSSSSSPESSESSLDSDASPRTMDLLLYQRRLRRLRREFQAKKKEAGLMGGARALPPPPPPVALTPELMGVQLAEAERRGGLMQEAFMALGSMVLPSRSAGPDDSSGDEVSSAPLSPASSPRSVSPPSARRVRRPPLSPLGDITNTPSPRAARKRRSRRVGFGAVVRWAARAQGAAAGIAAAETSGRGAVAWHEAAGRRVLEDGAALAAAGWLLEEVRLAPLVQVAEEERCRRAALRAEEVVGRVLVAAVGGAFDSVPRAHARAALRVQDHEAALQAPFVVHPDLAKTAETHAGSTSSAATSTTNTTSTSASSSGGNSSSSGSETSAGDAAHALIDDASTAASCPGPVEPPGGLLTATALEGVRGGVKASPVEVWVDAVRAPSPVEEDAASRGRTSEAPSEPGAPTDEDDGYFHCGHCLALPPRPPPPSRTWGRPTVGTDASGLQGGVSMAGNEVLCAVHTTLLGEDIYQSGGRAAWEAAYLRKAVKMWGVMAASGVRFPPLQAAAGEAADAGEAHRSALLLTAAKLEVWFRELCAVSAAKAEARMGRLWRGVRDALGFVEDKAVRCYEAIDAARLQHVSAAECSALRAHALAQVPARALLQREEDAASARAQAALQQLLVAHAAGGGGTAVPAMLLQNTHRIGQVLERAARRRLAGSNDDEASPPPPPPPRSHIPEETQHAEQEHAEASTWDLVTQCCERHEQPLALQARELEVQRGHLMRRHQDELRWLDKRMAQRAHAAALQADRAEGRLADACDDHARLKSALLQVREETAGMAKRQRSAYRKADVLRDRAEEERAKVDQRRTELAHAAGTIENLEAKLGAIAARPRIAGCAGLCDEPRRPGQPRQHAVAMWATQQQCLVSVEESRRRMIYVDEAAAFEARASGWTGRRPEEPDATRAGTPPPSPVGVRTDLTVLLAELMGLEEAKQAALGTQVAELRAQTCALHTFSHQVAQVVEAEDAARRAVETACDDAVFTLYGRLHTAPATLIAHASAHLQ